MGNPVTDGYRTTEPIDIDIDFNHIEKAFKKMQGIEKAVEIGTNRGIRELSAKLEMKLMENLGKYGLGQSSIAKGIYVFPLEHGVSIQVASDYAVYVEYGTGIKGDTVSHPNAEEDGWQYDVNEHGEGGWWYPTTEADPNKKKRYNKETGQLWAWTMGEPSRPFMYETYVWALNNATRIIRRCIREEIAKLG